MKVKSESEVAQSAAYQAPPSMGLSRQEYWSGVPLPSPERIGTDIQKTYTSMKRKMVWLAINMRQNNLLGRITTRHRGHYIVIRIIIP